MIARQLSVLSLERDTNHRHPGSFKTDMSTGSCRKRLPVAAKVALVTAGTIVEVLVTSEDSCFTSNCGRGEVKLPRLIRAITELMHTVNIRQGLSRGLFRALVCRVPS